ncbi:hypothetical protein BDC45DRAFT_568116 [Circinella umbellata]|nr:hypothetical protein BDC45DRAFT_568116 [Circinella umbellata]
MGFPIWAIVCAVAGVFALFFTGLAFFLIKRRRKSSPSTVDIAQDEKKNFQQKQKEQVTERQFEQKQQNNKTAAIRSHQQKINNIQPSIPNVTPHYQPVNTQEVKVVENEEEDLSEPKTRKMSRTERKQHQDNVKINLPLPPPSTSLFSDKMELSSEEAMELFDKYMNIDKSSDGEKPSFYSSVRRKTGTIRSTVRQSLRRQKSTKSTTPLTQLFGELQPSTPSSATSAEAYHNIMNDRPSTTSLSSTPQTTDHATIKPPSPVIPPVAHRQQQQQEQHYHSTDNYQEEEEVNVPHAIEAAAAAAYSDGKKNNASMHAARRVIRTASRKSKTRSMLVNEEDVMKMFAPSSVAAKYRDNNRSNAANFATVCENRTTGSVRRLVRDSIVTDKSATIFAVSATTAGNNRSAASTTNAREIAEWWSPEDTNKSPKVETTSSSNNNYGKSNSNKTPPPPRMPGKLVDEQKGNVDTIRRMLQASMTESESLTSIVTATRGRLTNEGLEGPDPEVSFSSSTVRTMIPENDQQQQQQQSFGAVSIAAQEKIEIDGTNFAMLQQNGHQTWNGRTNRISNRPSVLPPQQQSTEPSCNSSNNYMMDGDDYNSKSFFNTVNLGRRQSAKRKMMPWMNTEDTKRTPAQRERDYYLQSFYDQA